MKNKEAKAIFSSLENLSSIPPPDLWEKIEAQLDEPKRKKRPVIWWWVAACLLVGLSLPTVWNYNSSQRNKLQLNIEDNANEVVLQNDSKNNLNENKKVNENKSNIEKTSLDQKNNSNNEIKENVTTEQNNTSFSNSNSVATKTIHSISSKTKKHELFNNLKEGKENQFIAEKNNKSPQHVIIITNKNATANNYQTTSGIGVNKFLAISNSNGTTKTITNSSNTIVFESKQNNQHGESGETTNRNSITTNNNFSELNNTKAITENTAANDSLTKIKKEVAQLENALVELDKDKSKKKPNSEVIDKWSLQVFAGVMSSDNYTNEKEYGNAVASKQSTGYGVKTNYKLNKKWAVSSGFKINELGQKIDGVSYYERGNPQAFTSGSLPLASDNSPQNTTVSSNTVVFASTNKDYLFASNSKTATGFETGNVTQSLRYFEMPLEISYALLSKKKTNININTGGFVGKLISNDVLLNGSSIGENNNVNEFVYGTVLSSTLQYEFYKKTKFFIEPGMNYYINPLENQSFNQFQLMFNIGINVSF